MTTTTISVPEIHCDHCKESIEGALGSLRGILSAEVSVEAKNVRVEYDESVLDLARVRGAIEEQGYEVPG